MEFIICKRALHVEVLFLFFSCFASKCNFTLDTITSSHPITDPETIVSTNKTFELGFFSPPNTSNRYVGIWFSNVRVRSVVWVANREKPLNDSSGTITISEEGNLVVLNGQKDIIWSSNVSNSMVNSSARLLNTGNLVLQDGSDVKMLWQSFQHPSESLLQQMKLSSDQSTGEKVVLKSWRSPSDPSVGNFSAGVDLQTVPQLTVWNGNYKYWRSGPWDNQVFTGVESMTSTYQSRVIVDDDNEGSVTMSFTFVEGMTSFFRLNPDGSLVQIYWAEEKQDWEVTWSSLETECGVYGKCGPFGSCNSRTPQICTCLPGFEPAHEDAWKRGNFSGGCVRRLLLQCEGNGTGKKDGFQKLTTMKLPDFQELSDVPENKCESQCVNYCSCAAYTYLNGIGCMIWKGNLIDLQKFDNGGADLYIRLASSELDNERKKRTVIAISVSIGSIIMTMCAYFTWMRLVNHRGMEKLRKVPLFRNYSEFQENSTEVIQEITARDVKLKELPLCKFEELALATGNFNLTNKLGQGGFGPVYNGKFPNGQEIAVKRLSRSSGQGLEEFMNEVVVISKLQHRNLVRLLGCCIEGEEKMLIYEYMPNGSLDAFLFG
ncbi:Non-specific serine/threonine protein kinase [Bertholletia excelsa]